MVTFTKDCMIGVPQVDKEHEHLFELLNSAYEALASKDEERVAIVKNILVKLQNYAKEHFAHEEDYMEAIADPELPMQRKEHAQFTQKVQELMEKVNADANVETNVLEEILQFLTRWLYHHILSSDMMIGKSAVADREHPFAFTQNFHTGIPLVDEEHKQLFTIIARVHEVIHAQFMHDKYDEIVGILTELREYTEQHFHDEERVMEGLGYPGLPAQKLAHEAFVEKLVQIDLDELEELDDNQEAYLDSLIDFLVGWLVNHILHMDKKIAEYAAQKA